MICDSILKSVIANAARHDGPVDEYTVAWYRGMICAAQHDDDVDQLLLQCATRAVDELSAARNSPAGGA